MNNQRATNLGIAAIVGLALLAGIWISGLAAPNVRVHAILAGVWTMLVAAALWALGRRRHHSTRVPWLAFGATLLAVVVIGSALSRPREVNERVVAAEPSAATPAPRTGTKADTVTPEANVRKNVLVTRGRFTPLEHKGQGIASVIRLANGAQKLTLTNFSTDSGPDLFVYAVAGNPHSDGDVRQFVNLGRLKGTSGDQQYDLPRDFDPDRYRHIYVWCRAFTVGFTRAELDKT